MEYKAIIFDMDGVIFDSERAVLRGWQELSEKYGFPDVEIPYLRCCGVNAAASRQIFLDYYGEDFPYDRYCAEQSRNYHARYDGGRLPVKPGIGKGAAIEYRFEPSSADGERELVLQFLPDFALWPGLTLGVDVSFDGGKPQFAAVPGSDSNLGEFDRVRNCAVQDNFIRVALPVPAGARSVQIVASAPGAVIDRVGIRECQTSR